MIGRRLAIVLSMAAGLVVSAAPAVSAKIVTVPEGNRNVSQPRVPGASVKRTRQTKTTFDRKYEKIRDSAENRMPNCAARSRRRRPNTALIPCILPVPWSGSTPTMSTPMTGCNPTTSKRWPMRPAAFRSAMAARTSTASSNATSLNAAPR